MIEQLVARVFSMRDVAHKAHWKTKSYAQHVALAEFYEGVIPAIDAIVECYQGMYGLIDPEPAQTGSDGDMVEKLRSEVEWIEANKVLISEGVEAIGNLVDGLTALYLTTAYKLENLQ